MDVWRKAKNRAKKRIGDSLRLCAAVSGRLVEKSGEDIEVTGTEKFGLLGHRIYEGPEFGRHQVTRYAFRNVPPALEEIGDVFYSASGMAFLKGVIWEKYSVAPIRVRDILGHPPRSWKTVDACAIVECDMAYSYGDWTHCFLGPILSADIPDVPVLIPAHLAKRDYVIRDLRNAKVNWISHDGWTKINRAFVIRKRNYRTNWSARDVESFRRRFSVSPPTPTPGSITYLARGEYSGETVPRNFPSSRVSSVLEPLGARIVPQSALNTDTAPGYATHAETVVGDHGSGMLNILFWKPRNVIELVVDEWWCDNTVFVAAEMGVENFAVLRVDDLSEDEIRVLLNRCFQSFDVRLPVDSQARPREPVR